VETAALGCLAAVYAAGSLQVRTIEISLNVAKPENWRFHSPEATWRQPPRLSGGASRRRLFAGSNNENLSECE